jgi:hypothetical protein
MWGYIYTPLYGVIVKHMDEFAFRITKNLGSPTCKLSYLGKRHHMTSDLFSYFDMHP